MMQLFYVSLGGCKWKESALKPGQDVNTKRVRPKGYKVRPGGSSSGEGGTAPTHAPPLPPPVGSPTSGESELTKPWITGPFPLLAGTKSTKH
mmetsp:Transcript_19218/g.58003  ORF Transcript_19218/g.58003 Transcript_19218/m.58003 type:complete len:92 (-) Transcript_19218:2138-2413(-)